MSLIFAILGQKWRSSFGEKFSMWLFPFPSLVFPKNREIPGNSREVIFENSQTGTTIAIPPLHTCDQLKLDQLHVKRASASHNSRTLVMSIINVNWIVYG